MRRCFLALLLLCLPMHALSVEVPSSARARHAAERVQDDLTQRLAALGVSWGAKVYLRVFKESSELELWVDSGPRFLHLQTWPICTWSGQLGPKLRQGDGQAPEGFYQVSASQLNPHSRFHLAFNLGYPNAFDRAHQRTGDFLMVHGNCVSIGCYAMGDAAIEEIYTLLAAALQRGQGTVPVHVFPFRMDAGWQQAHANSEWLPFWQQLELGYRAFAESGKPPRIGVVQGRYTVLPN